MDQKHNDRVEKVGFQIPAGLPILECGSPDCGARARWEIVLDGRSSVACDSCFYAVLKADPPPKQTSARFIDRD